MGLELGRLEVNSAGGWGPHGPPPRRVPSPLFPARTSRPGPGLVSGVGLLGHTGNQVAALAGKWSGTAAAQGHALLNADESPVREPDGRNAYVARPLPALPRLRPPPGRASGPPGASKYFPMDGRPSTSNGPGTGFIRGPYPSTKPRSNYDNRRMSRDDMYLPSMDRKRGGESYRTVVNPVRVDGLPTPEHSPRRAWAASLRNPSPEPLTMPARMLTPESFSSGEIPIGMALGSPSSFTPWRSPPPWQQATTQPSRPIVSGAEAQTQMQTQMQPQIQPQPQSRPWPVEDNNILTPVPLAPPPRKQSKRKLFGLFGSRKHVEDPTVRLSDGYVFRPPGGEKISRSITMKESTGAASPWPKHEPIIVRSNTTLTEAPPYSPGRFAHAHAHAHTYTHTHTHTHTHTPRPPTASDSATATATMAAPTNRTTTTTVSTTKTPPTMTTKRTSKTSPKPTLLDVEIPDVRLERYSVMFSGVINPTNPASSLLARRQAALEKLKTVNEHPRSSTPPNLEPQLLSPSFVLFPAPPMQSPSQSQSQSQPQPQPQQPSTTARSARKEKKTVTIVSPREMEERNRVLQVERLREQRNQQRQKHNRIQPQYHPPIQPRDLYFVPDRTGLLDSPSSLDSEILEELRKPSRAVSSPSPQWQMLAPPPPPPPFVEPTDQRSTSATSSSSAHSSITRPSPSSSSSSAISSMQRPSFDFAADTSLDPALMAAVESSIARQITLSRQQRDMLKPLTVAPLKLLGGGTPRMSPGLHGRPTPSPVQIGVGSGSGSFGRDARVGEAKVSTPTLVVPREAYEKKYAHHRRSTRVVVEGAGF